MDQVFGIKYPLKLQVSWWIALSLAPLQAALAALLPFAKAVLRLAQELQAMEVERSERSERRNGSMVGNILLWKS